MNEEMYKQTILYLATKLAQMETENERNQSSSEYWYGCCMQLEQGREPKTPCQE